MIGVAELDGNIYAVCQGSDAIRSYSCDDSLRRLRDIVVRGVDGVCDLVACFKTHRLYVADQQGICVVSPSSHSKVRFPGTT